MAITQAMCTSFKVRMLEGGVDLSADTTKTYKLALFTSSATLNASTTQYTTTNEVTGTGYTAGGKALNVLGISTSGTTAFIDFDDVTWADATITARGGLIYEETTGNPAVAVVDFGSDRTSTASNFVATMPTADVNSAIIRIA